MNSLSNLLSNFSTKRILVVGDLMLDAYMYGAAARISPEAPVPVVDVRSQSVMLGGGGNVVANLVELGCSVSVVGVVGDDDDGKNLINLFERIGVDTNGIIVDENRKTTKKCRVIAGNQQVVRIDFENSDVLKSDAYEKVRAATLSAIKEADGIIISDYMKGVVSRALVEEIVSLKGDRLLSVDPKEPSMNRYRGINLIKPNLHATKRAVENEFSGKEFDLKKAGESLFKRLDCDYLLITLGSEGMALFQSEDRFRQFNTDVRRVFDVSGAGDTVLAAVTLALVSGVSIEEAVKIGNLAAGIVVEKVGTATVSKEELAKRVNKREFERALE